MIVLKSTKKVSIDLTYPDNKEFVYCSITNFVLNIEESGATVNGNYYWEKEIGLVEGVRQYEKIGVKSFGTSFTYQELNSLYNYIKPTHENPYDFPSNLIKDIRTTLLFYIIAINPAFGLIEETDWEIII